ncbi:MAG: hypothetical protein ACI9XZ_003803, partial [Alphaproteobacteria bacterium]
MQDINSSILLLNVAVQIWIFVSSRRQLAVVQPHWWSY